MEVLPYDEATGQGWLRYIQVGWITQLGLPETLNLEPNLGAHSQCGRPLLCAFVCPSTHHGVMLMPSLNIIWSMCNVVAPLFGFVVSLHPLLDLLLASMCLRLFPSSPPSL